MAPDPTDSHLSTSASVLVSAAMHRYPEYTRGEILWLLLPARLRNRIYVYHIAHSPGPNPPLREVCRTFRREMDGLYMSRKAIFLDRCAFNSFLKLGRTLRLTPYVSYLAFDLTPFDSKLRCATDMRDTLDVASREFKFVTVIAFLTFTMDHIAILCLIDIVEHETLKQFAHLEVVNVTRSLGCQKTFRGSGAREPGLMYHNTLSSTGTEPIEDGIETDERNDASRTRRSVMSMHREFSQYVRSLEED